MNARTRITTAWLLSTAMALAACSGNKDNPSSPTVKEVQVTVPQATMVAGTSAKVTATSIFTDSSKKDCSTSATYSSSDASIVTVAADASGATITANAAGTATVTATCDGVSGSVTITVTAATLDHIEMTPTTLSLAKGTTTTTGLKATGIMSDTTHQDISADVTWTSSDTTIATVTGGNVTAVAVGTATITASKDGKQGTVAVTVTAATLSSVQVDQNTASVVAGLSVNIKLNGLYSDDSSQDVTNQATWSSSADTVATVAGGRVTGVTAGTATITGTFGGFSSTSTITVTDAVPQSLDITPSSIMLPAGRTQALKAMVTMSDGTKQDLSATATWESSDITVATVSSAAADAGTVTGLVPGHVDITATVGALSNHAGVIVSAAQLDTIEIQPAGPLSIALGLPLSLIAQGHYSDGSKIDLTNQVTWSSEDETVASISNAVGSQGTVTTVAAGHTTIDAQLGLVTSSIDINVTDAVINGLTLDAGDATVAAGLQITVTANGTFSDGTSKDVTADVTWSSDDDTIASVDAQGQITGVAEGQTKIHGLDGNVSADVTVTVTAALLFKVEISGGSTVLPVGRNLPLKANGIYTDGQSKDITADVTWSSSDDTVATFADPDAANSLSGVASGSITVTAASGDVSGTQDVTVLPTPAKSISLSPDSPVVNAGEVTDFTVTANYDDGSSDDVTYWITFTSDDNNIVAFSPDINGEASALAEGTANVTADLDGVQASTLVTVKAKGGG